MELSKEVRTKIAVIAAVDNLENINVGYKPVNVKHNFYTRYGKRVIDIVISLTALIITLPINAALAFLTYFDVGSPILFKQYRPGKDGRSFTIIKFRNMTNEVDADGNLLPGSKRVTKLGKFVRKTSLDELLNFLSVLKGDMSIIGPRPLKEEYLNRYSERHKMRHSVKPGLECPPIKAVSYTWGWQEQFENDVWYVENVSLILDIKLALKIVQAVFDKGKSSIRSEAKRGGFIGYDENGIAFGSDNIPEKYIDIIGVSHDNQLNYVKPGNFVNNKITFKTSEDKTAI